MPSLSTSNRGHLRTALEAQMARSPACRPDGGRWLAGWALASALAGTILYLVGGHQAAFLGLNGLGAGLPDWVWEWFTVLGDERVAFALTLFFSRRWPRLFWALLLAALAGAAYTHGLKPLFGALRPPAVLPPDAVNLIGPGHRQGSFPSGHAVTAAVFFGVWVYYLRSLPLRALLVLLAVAAGLSRVAVGVHWPVDVAFGLAGGVVAAWVGVTLAARVAWGACNPVAHLGFVLLAVVMSASLLWWDGGYAGAARMQQVIALAALAYAAYAYLPSPRAVSGHRQRHYRRRRTSPGVFDQVYPQNQRDVVFDQAGHAADVRADFSALLHSGRHLRAPSKAQGIAERGCAT